MKFMTSTVLATIAMLAVPGQAQTNMLTNPSFENGGVAGWSSFGNVFPENSGQTGIVPRSGNWVTKMFGGFTGMANTGGIFQAFPATPGDFFLLDCYARHWSGDALVGAAGTGNSMVMRIAFFDNTQTEIFGVERTVLDGTFATDVWHDPVAITAFAPAGTVEVQAFILFVQPGVDPGAGYVDDILFFAQPENPTYPGTGDDFVLTTGVGLGGTSGGYSNFTKIALAGDLVEANLSSPGGTYVGSSYYLLGQIFATGAPPTPQLPNLHLSLSQPIFVFAGSPAPVFGGPTIPGGPFGISSYFVTPPGLTGASLMLHGLILDPSAMNGAYAATDGYAIEFQ